jgi:hypothetical protein
MIMSDKYRTCDQNEVDGATLLTGEENPRGVEKPGGFFSLCGAPCTGLAAEKPGGFFSGPPSGGDGGAGFQPAQNEYLVVAGQAGSLPHEEPEKLLQKLAAPVRWKRGGRPSHQAIASTHRRATLTVVHASQMKPHHPTPAPVDFFSRTA